LETVANTQLTWTDGFTLTVPRSRLVDLGQCDNPRFWGVPVVEEFPVLNYAPEAAVAVADLQLCDARELPAAMVKASAGLRLLRQVWPSAYAAARRQLKGLVLLEERGFTRSHSPLGLLGVVAMTAVDEVRVGDLVVHEASHIRLNLMRQFDPLWKDREPGRLHKSPWRQDPRPLSGIVLGVHAFLNVAQYYRRVAEWRGGDEQAETLFERQREKVRTAWARAKAFAEPTALGVKFFAELDREVLDL
jgi:HEXXH motif-containing protein